MKNRLISIVILSITLLMVTPVLKSEGQIPSGCYSQKFLLDNSQPGSDFLLSGNPVSDTVIVSRGSGDTTSIRIGNRHVLIIERDGKTDINIDDRSDERADSKSLVAGSFKGNWSGFEIGLNNFVNSDFSTTFDPDDSFMELNGVRSRNYNFNLMQYGLSLSGDNIGLVTGLGFEINNYRFAENNTIKKEDGVIVPVNYDDFGIKLDRTRLRTYYLNVPLLLEFQTNHARRSQRAYLATGVIGGLNIGSNSRIVYKDNSSKSRDIVRDDFYLSTFRYGMTVRAGYRSVKLYANYYPVSLFRDKKGPEIYPFAIGFTVIGF